MDRHYDRGHGAGGGADDPLYALCGHGADRLFSKGGAGGSQAWKQEPIGRCAMADVLESVFKQKKIVWDKLIPFGFVETDEGYRYQQMMPDCGLLLTVRVTKQGQLSTEVTDPVTDAPYTLHLLEGAAGSFVGAVRSQYQALLADIASQCFEADVFRSEQARRSSVMYARLTGMSWNIYGLRCQIMLSGAGRIPRNGTQLF